MGFRISKTFFGKSQVAMEFVMLVMLAFMIMAVFSVIARDRMMDLRQEEEYAYLQDVVSYVNSEILIASNVEDGYSRQFSIPSTLNGVIYNISFSQGYITAESVHHEYAARTAEVEGSIAKGQNTISKKNGTVYINS